ncbi:helix-turn-helix domain-containing protein [Coprococcus sp. AM14-16]|nr:helix-turn-helix domain-containing protein [Coprococcus sp. AM14-16]
MLRNSSMSVTDVMTYAYGFSGTSYFCELFHRHYGITPNEYRKENL